MIKEGGMLNLEAQVLLQKFYVFRLKFCRPEQHLIYSIKLLMLPLVPNDGVAMTFNPEHFAFWKKLIH